MKYSHFLHVFQIGFLFLNIQRCSSSHIVFLQHIAGHSHVVATWNFAQALVAKGHNVTFIAAVSPPSTNPLITYIIPQRVKDFMEDVINADFDVDTRMEGTSKPLFQSIDELEINGCEILLSSNELQTWLNSTAPVDLIYVDNFPECALGLAYKLESKLAIFGTLPLFPNIFDSFGIPSESSSVPTLDMTFKSPLTFINRVKLTLTPLLWHFTQVLSFETIENIIKKHLQLDYLPPMDQLVKNISLVLTNGHFLDEYRRSLPPFVVSVPAMHVEETHKPLSKEIEDFINFTNGTGQHPKGFVYISLGTVAKAPKLPQHVREVFYNSIKAFPEIQFLWRWDGDFPTDTPKNLKLSKWFNQQDLLGHPKIRGFVTQAGRPSSQEALMNGVTMITLPILGDQDYNAVMLESLGVSINLEIVGLTEKELTNAFHTMLHNKQLKDRSKEISQIYKDLPMKPVDTAVWWTEYIVRHKDTSHLKPIAIDQPWYKRRLLDVWAFIALCTLATIGSILFLTNILIKLIWSLGNSITKQKKFKTL